METALQIGVGIATVMLAGLGIMSMFAPRKMIGNFAIEPIGTQGMSTVRSLIGGLFLASVTMLIGGLTTGETLGFLAVALILGIVAVGRVVSIFADGFIKEVVPPLIVELVIIAVLLAAYIQRSS